MWTNISVRVKRLTRGWALRHGQFTAIKHTKVLVSLRHASQVLLMQEQLSKNRIIVEVSDWPGQLADIGLYPERGILRILSR